MNFLGSSLSQSRSDLTTPVGQLIDQATSDTLLAPDWALNLAVCDAINTDPTGPTGEQATRAFRRKLRDSNPKVLQLTLTLIEAAVKNADHPGGEESSFHALVGTTDFLSNVAALTDGKKGWDVKEQALALLQQWGLSFQAKQATLAFCSTYMDLRLQGVQFPRLEASSPIFTPPPQSSSPEGGLGTSSSSSSNAPATSSAVASAGAATAAAVNDIDDNDVENEAAAAAAATTTAEELAKLEQDLHQVRDRARACLEMLPNSAGISAGDTTLSDAVGFLEACKPRLADVIEAGMGGGKEGGGLTEAMVELALEVHEEVVQALEAEKAQAVLRQQQEGGDRKEAAAETGGRTEDLLEFDQHAPPAEAQRPIPTHPAAADTTTATGGGEGGDHVGGGDSTVAPVPHDPLDLFAVAPSPAPAVAPAAAAPVADDLLTSSLEGMGLGDAPKPPQAK